MIKKLMAKLANYPRLRVLIFIIVGLVVVALFIRIFTGGANTTPVPPSNITPQSVTPTQPALVGRAQYQKLSQQAQQNQMQQASSSGQSYFANVFPNAGNATTSGQAVEQGSTYVGTAPNGTVQGSGPNVGNAKAANSYGVNPAMYNAGKPNAQPNMPNNYAANPTYTNNTAAGNTYNNAGASSSNSTNPYMAGVNNFPGSYAQGNSAPSPQAANTSYAGTNSNQAGYGNNQTAVNPVNFYHQQYGNNASAPAAVPGMPNPQDVNAVAAQMNAQLQNIGQDWKLPTAKMVMGTAPAPSTVGTGVAAPKNVLIKAGTIYYAVLETALDSDQPGTPVMAQIVEGPYNGAKLLGQFKMEGEKLVLEFNTMSVPNQGASINVGKAYAIDGSTAQNALASDVDHHYMLRYGSLFAAGFLQGFGNAYASYMYNGCPPNSPCFVINTNGSNNNSNSLPPTQSAVYQGLGQVGTNLSGVMMQNFNTAPTVTLNQGTGMGILFMQDVKQ